MTRKTKCQVDLQGVNIRNTVDWCSENLTENQWEVIPLHLFPLECRFTFDTEQTKLLVLLNLDFANKQIV